MRKSKILILLASLLIISVSCKDWLYIQPEDGVVRQNYWQSKEDLEQAVNGVYASMLDPDMVSRLCLWGEIRADMIAPTPTAPIDYINIANGNILSDNSICKWDLFYRTINLCNVVLHYAPDVKTIDPTLTDEEYNGRVAEMLTIRSLLYFYLVRTFGEVPLKLTATLDDNSDFQIAKSSEADIMKQIIDDLETAKSKAFITQDPYGYYGSTDGYIRYRGNDKGKITKFTVEALLADVYLWNEQYDKSAENCKAIIDTKKFSLLDTTYSSNWFDDVFIQGNSFAESIFELQNNTAVLTKKNVNSPFYTLFGGGTPQFKITNSVSDFFPVSAEASKPDIRGNKASYNFDNMKVWKYIVLNGGAEMSGGRERYANWYFYRYSDVMLMYAEAVANDANKDFNNDTTIAMPLIREIRFKRFADPSSDKAITTYDDLNTLILNERVREFAFEGKRWFDILRFTRRNNYANLNIMKDMIRRSAPGAVQQNMLIKAEDTRSYYLPIYYQELVNNKLLTQNDFYYK